MRVWFRCAAKTKGAYEGNARAKKEAANVAKRDQATAVSFCARAIVCVLCVCVWVLSVCERVCPCVFDLCVLLKSSPLQVCASAGAASCADWPGGEWGQVVKGINRMRA